MRRYRKVTVVFASFIVFVLLNYVRAGGNGMMVPSPAQAPTSELTVTISTEDSTDLRYVFSVLGSALSPFTRGPKKSRFFQF